MGWLLFWAVLGTTLALVFFAWRKWIAPWRAIQRLANQIAHGEAPSTFLVEGGAEPLRVGLTLEKIFARLEELNRSVAGRESGTQAILRAMQDGLLVVDANRRVILANRAFRKWFGLRRIAAGEPLLDVLRNPAIERLIRSVTIIPWAAYRRAGSQSSANRNLSITRGHACHREVRDVGGRDQQNETNR